MHEHGSAGESRRAVPVLNSSRSAGPRRCPALPGLGRRSACAQLSRQHRGNSLVLSGLGSSCLAVQYPVFVLPGRLRGRLGGSRGDVCDTKQSLLGEERNLSPRPQRASPLSARPKFLLALEHGTGMRSVHFLNSSSVTK